MKAKHIFWGLLFVSLGILILVNNFSGIYWDWMGLWKLWPLLFILWGIAIMVKNNAVKIIFAGIAGIVLAISLFASFNTIVHLTSKNFDVIFDDRSDYKYEITNYSEPYTDSIKTVQFNFKAGAGSFTSISDTTSDLLSARTEGIKNNYELTKTGTGNDAILNMNMKETSIHIGKHGIRNRVELRFNPLPVWNLNFDVGAASVDLDLASVKVRNFTIDMGAASLKARLGENLNRTDVEVKTGASKVELSVPENTGCEIRTEGALNSKHFSDFKKISSGLYRTDNFDSSEKKIFIHIDSGVSSLNINRYSGSNW